MMGIFKHDCNKDGHQFEARYSYEMPAIDIPPARMSHAQFLAIIESIKTKKYIHDICVKCGKIVE